jgi:hypothetical protein
MRGRTVRRNIPVITVPMEEESGNMNRRTCRWGEIHDASRELGRNNDALATRCREKMG